MKSFWGLKAIAGLLGLALLIYGVSVIDSDPTLRVMQTVRMADVEAGQLPLSGQLVRLDDAWLLPSWVVEHSKSRRGGEHSHVTVGLGSRDSAERVARGEAVDVKLWLRLPTDHRTREAADQAMRQVELYTTAVPRTGVIDELSTSLRDTVAADGPWKSSATLRLHEGKTPSTAGHGIGMLAAGLVMLLFTAAWLLIDRQHDAWRDSLGGAGRTVFGGASPWLALGLLGGLASAALAYWVAELWVDSMRKDWTLMAIAFALLGASLAALWRQRLAFVVSADGLVRVGPGAPRTLLSWAEVDGITSVMQKVSGQLKASFQLHAGKKTVKLGTGLFSGGLAQPAALGGLLNEIVTQRVAPGVLARLSQGEQVSFGGIGVRREGLVKGGKAQGELLAWNDIQSITAEKGKLKIKKQGKRMAWDAIGLGKLRNLELLLSLVSHEGLPQPSAASG
jgi:hypothetical protein